MKIWLGGTIRNNLRNFLKNGHEMFGKNLFLFLFLFFLFGFPIVACMETKVLIICRIKYKILSYYIWWTIRLKKSYF
jgi:hypothetical protein